MGAPTSSYAIAGIAIRVSGALKPHHHDKVETPSVGIGYCYNLKLHRRMMSLKIIILYLGFTTLPTA
jgi:hypothetical protein